MADQGGGLNAAIAPSSLSSAEDVLGWHWSTFLRQRSYGAVFPSVNAGDMK